MFLQLENILKRATEPRTYRWHDDWRQDFVSIGDRSITQSSAAHSARG